MSTFNNYFDASSCILGNTGDTRVGSKTAGTTTTTLTTMTTTPKSRRPSPLTGVNRGTEDDDILGVIGALSLICELESKLRQAIQKTHPLTTSMDWDFNAADRERGALLAIRFVE